MILHDRCSTSYDLASLFRGRRSTFDRWSGKIAKRIGSIFEGRLAELRLPRETTSERPKVVQTPGVFNILTSKCASR